MVKSKNYNRQKLTFQFLITLLGVDPLVWRRIHVPGEYSFWDLHVAIQDAMGWEGYHLHEFILNAPESGEQVRVGVLYDEDPYEIETLPDHLTPIADYFVPNNEVAQYTYDFGDGWRHIITFEGLVQPDETVQYPVCISGERKCPPEDCGGPGGYAYFLEAIRNEDHEEHESYLDWIGGQFDQNEFSPDQINFDDPVERWRIAFDS